MTRINCGIMPSELSTKHLIAELREIKRIPNHVYTKSGNLNTRDIPEKFTLGTGHVRFFYNKLGYLHKRYQDLYIEAKHIRGFNIEDFSQSFINAISIRPDLNCQYEETLFDRNIILERLLERDYQFYQSIKL